MKGITLNLHFLQQCNYRCGFCYSRLLDSRKVRVNLEAWLSALHRLRESFAQRYCDPIKFTFVGGEPTLYPYLVQLVRAAKSVGATTQIVTNGSRLSKVFFAQFAGSLDYLCCSIDSFQADTLRQIGRQAGHSPVMTFAHWHHIVAQTQAAGMTLKVNTVVNRLNVGEILAPQMAALAPIRWKLLQVTRVEGENEATYPAFAIERAQFHQFVAANRHPSLRLVVEDEAAIQGTYVMLDPQGRFQTSFGGKKRVSRSVFEVDIATAWQEISFSYDEFLARGGADHLRPISYLAAA